MPTWQELDSSVQREEYAKQALVQRLVDVMKGWARNYCRLARALADEFGEEEVLDLLEQTWWELQYEGGLSFREDFERDPEAALAAMIAAWRHGPNSVAAYMGTIVDTEVTLRHWELLTCSCYHDVFREMGERKIGMSWCMSDLAAVAGWSPRVRMEFPHVLLRGSAYCLQVRDLVDEGRPGPVAWTRELSERYGWRSAARLEHGGEA
jgi:hypothetical protein